MVFTILLIQITLGRQLFTPNFRGIAVSLHIRTQDALTSSSLAESVAGSAAMLGAIVWGCLADRFSPHTSLSIAAPLASTAIFLCALTHWHNGVALYMTSRALNGFCAGGALPLGMARVAEMTSDFYRPRGVLHIMLVNAISSGLGQTAATIYGPEWKWYSVCFVVAGIGSGLYLLVLLFDRPNDANIKSFKQQEARDVTNTDGIETISQTYFEEELQEVINDADVVANANSTQPCAPFSCNNLLIYMQGLCACTTWSAILVLIYELFDNHYGITDRPQQAIILVIWGICSLCGKVAAVTLAEHFILSPNNPRSPFFIAVLTLLSQASLLLSLLAHAHVDVLLLLFVMSSFFGSMPGPIIHTFLLCTNSPSLRGTVSGLLELADNVGYTLGPVILTAVLPHFHNVAHILSVFTIGWTFAALCMTRLKSSP